MGWARIMMLIGLWMVGSHNSVIEGRYVSECYNQRFDTVTCPVGSEIGITSVIAYAHTSGDSPVGTCRRSSSTCSQLLPARGSFYLQVGRACNGKRACDGLSASLESLTCGTANVPTSFVTVTYMCNVYNTTTGGGRILTEVDYHQTQTCDPNTCPSDKTDLTTTPCSGNVCMQETTTEASMISTEASVPLTEATVTSAAPLFGPIAGGTEIVIEGSGFPSIGVNSVRVGDVILKVIASSTTEIRAVTPEVDESYINQPLQITIQPQSNSAKIIETSFTFTYRANPSVTSVDPLQTIPSGGVTLIVNGSFFDFVAEPKMNMTLVLISEGRLEETGYQYTTDCVVQDPNTMHCVTPELDIPENNTVDDVILYIGIILDGVPNYRNLSDNPELREYGIITVTLDPIFKENQLFTPSGTMNIEGEHIKTCCHLNEYSVYVGSGNVRVMSATDEDLVCRPPDKEPEAEHKVDGGYEVHVHVGTNLKFFVGTMTYKRTLPGWWWYPVVVAACIILVIIVVVIIVVVTRRRRKRQKKKDANSEATSSAEGQGKIDFPAVNPAFNDYELETK